MQYGQMTDAPPLVVVAGATATGKTQLGIRLAEAVIASGRPAVVVSADSRQVFRGLDIGTAKVSAADRTTVPHHGLDLVSPDETFSVADFARYARGVVADVGTLKGVVFLVGGTGLFLRAGARGLDTEALPADPGVRASLEAELSADGPVALRERLLRQAPILAASTDLANPRRVVRALEIAAVAGDGPRPAPLGYDGRVTWIGLAVDEDTHRQRILARARAPFDAGLLDEARELRTRFDPTLAAFTAIGYHEAWAVLDGTDAREAAIERVAARTVAFARRQRTWFRSEREIAWVDATRGDATSSALALMQGGLS
ncbi:tRNA (adenosine(37)-N6)-dimethylallyltransferase MiaA [soil metagenome]